MFDLKFVAGTLAVVASLVGLVDTSAAQGRRINALVMLEDAPPETMARVVPIYRRVLPQLQETLNTRGIQVYDENISDMIFQRPDRRRRSDVELVTIARAVSARVPIDVVVLFEIVASAQKDAVVPTIVRPRIRMPGRILNVRSGQFMGAFEVDGSVLRPLPNPCDDVCLFENVGNEARQLAGDLGAALAQKLENFSTATAAPTAPQSTGPSKDSPAPQLSNAPAAPRCDSLSGEYVIRLQDFPTDELLEIERNLRIFGCFEELRPVGVRATSTEYQYRTSAGADRINRNLRVMLDYLGLKGQVRFDGTSFDVVKVQTRQ